MNIQQICEEALRLDKSFGPSSKAIMFRLDYVATLARACLAYRKALEKFANPVISSTTKETQNVIDAYSAIAKAALEEHP